MVDRRALVVVAVAVVTVGVAVPGVAVADDGLPPPPPGAGDPPPPAGPVIPIIGAPLGAPGLDMLAQSGADGVPGELGAPAVSGLDRTSILGLNAVPSAPGAGPGTVPNLNPFNNAYGVGALNMVPAAPGQGQQFGVAPGDENADVTRRKWFGRYVDLYRAGDLKGGLLGQVPQQQLGEPLPGTAPLPGTVIPAGPVQFLPDPADGPTAPPGLVLPPPTG